MLSFKPCVEQLEDRMMPSSVLGGDSHLQNGLAPEYMAALVRSLDSNVWTSMPHQSDADYVRTCASPAIGVAKPIVVEPAITALHTASVTWK